MNTQTSSRKKLIRAEKTDPNTDDLKVFVIGSICALIIFCFWYVLRNYIDIEMIL